MTAHRLTLVNGDRADAEVILCWLPWASLVKDRNGTKWIRRKS